jgi:hypothetical protein
MVQAIVAMAALTRSYPPDHTQVKARADAYSKSPETPRIDGSGDG